MEEGDRERLLRLASEWRKIAAIKFSDARKHEQKGSYPQRFIEHGAICYCNCANQLEQAIKAGDTAADFNLEVIEQDPKGP